MLNQMRSQPYSTVSTVTSDLDLFRNGSFHSTLHILNSCSLPKLLLTFTWEPSGVAASTWVACVHFGASLGYLYVMICYSFSTIRKQQLCPLISVKPHHKRLESSFR